MPNTVTVKYIILHNYINLYHCKYFSSYYVYSNVITVKKKIIKKIIGNILREINTICREE
jgi:hypothetical protein